MILSPAGLVSDFLHLEHQHFFGMSRCCFKCVGDWNLTYVYIMIAESPAKFSNRIPAALKYPRKEFHQGGVASEGLVSFNSDFTRWAISEVDSKSSPPPPSALCAPPTPSSPTDRSRVCCVSVSGRHRYPALFCPEAGLGTVVLVSAAIQWLLICASCTNSCLPVHVKSIF